MLRSHIKNRRGLITKDDTQISLLITIGFELKLHAYLIHIMSQSIDKSPIRPTFIKNSFAEAGIISDPKSFAVGKRHLTQTISGI